MNAIEFNHVWKKFRKGEKFNSLRDGIPNFFKSLVTKKNGSQELQGNEFWAVKDVDFAIKPGEVVGIIGPNGAGKSTILKLLSRILVPNKGSLKINGRLSALIEVTAGFHPELTGRENVYLNGTILGMKRKEIEEKFDDIVEFSGVEQFIDTPVKRYSTGMYSRLGFSVAAYVSPDVLLVDEVLSVGDKSFQGKCAQKMRELLKSGVTIVLVSHNLPLIQTLCRRVILLNQGAIIREGTAEDVLPYYENLIYEQKEEEIKKKFDAIARRVRIETKTLVNIVSVKIASRSTAGNTIDSGVPLKFTVAYQSKEKISHPALAIDIVRSDGVVCCSANTKDGGVAVPDINGPGSFEIDLGQINLAPGVYFSRISICDEKMLHTYVTRDRDIFRIKADGRDGHQEAVFLPQVEWHV